MARTKSTITTNNGITWYYEQEGSGPNIVLVPDGFGECQMFDLAITQIASAGFCVTTMDMPGMSRSAAAPPETYQDVTAQKLAGYVISLLDALNIARASFWGCSSGASTVLALVVDFPSRVVNAMPHEAPTLLDDSLTPQVPMDDDDAIAQFMVDHVLPTVVGDEVKYQQLGKEAHARLHKNYAVWTRGYPRTIPLSTPLKALEQSDSRKWPVDWTIGHSSPAGFFYQNALTAGRAGINFSILPGKHFPYVSHVDEFATYVIETTRKYQ